MDWLEVAEEADPWLRKQNFDECESIVRKALSRYATTPFHLVMDSGFSNDPMLVAEAFSTFYAKEIQRISLSAIYTETNGFDINPDRWYFDLFGYTADGGLEDVDWLADWQSKQYGSITLTGMEELQSVYSTTEIGSEPAYLSSLLVVIKFQRLIYSARPHMEIEDVPVYSTGHDYDFIARC